MNRIFFSIIIAVYNVEDYLEECLDSIINQVYSNWEVILVDDGSTDLGSARICDEYAQKDKRFKACHISNQGSLMARRYGIKQAKGDYVIFIDSDDYISSDLLKDVSDIIGSTGSDLVIYRYQRFGGVTSIASPIVFEEGTIVGEGGLSKNCIWERMISSNDFNNLCLKVGKRELIDDEIDYSKYAFLQYGTDFMQSLPILDNAQKIYFTEKIYYYYRCNNTGISSSRVGIFDDRKIALYIKTRRTLADEKMKYLQKYGLKSCENLKLFYKVYFTNCINALLLCLEGQKDKEKESKVIQCFLEDERLEIGKKYLTSDDFKGIYRIVYHSINDINRINVVIDRELKKRRIKGIMYNAIGKILMRDAK